MSNTINFISLLVAATSLISCASAVNITAENSTKPIMANSGGYKSASAFNEAAFNAANEFPLLPATPDDLNKVQKKYGLIRLKSLTISSYAIQHAYGGGSHHDGATALDAMVGLTKAKPVVKEISFGGYHGFDIFVHFSKNYVELSEVELEDAK